LADQLKDLSVYSEPIRLTSSAANVPITVTKHNAYPVDAVLTLSSDKLVFLKGRTSGCSPSSTDKGANSIDVCTINLDHSDNTIYVQVRTRTAGHFTVSAKLESPKGGLVLSTGVLTVQATYTSVVAILLSAGAVLVLLAWWTRTLLRNRREKRSARQQRKLHAKT
jgi:YbbR domain-containing protein